MNNDGILNKLALFLRNLSVLKRVLIAGVIILLLVLVPSFILLSKNSTKIAQKPLEKTWEIILNFNTKDQKLTAKKVTLLNKKIIQDDRSAGFSPYELVMYDSNDEAIYRIKINITTALLYDMSIEPPASGSANPPMPEILDTVLYTPFLEKGTKIIIKKNNEEILKIDLPKQTGFSFPGIPKAYAATCNPLVVAFISDGYTDFNQFHQDIDTFKGVFFSVEPYSSQSIFDFRVIDNSQPLGCKSTGSLNCINNPAVVQITKSAQPDASKAIVLVNMQIPTGGPLGVTSGIGGDVAVFPNNGGNITNNAKIVAAHEFLGHAVSQLYDRYVSSDSGYGIIQSSMPRSNCTDNSSGESFWSGAGGTGVYLGCSNRNNYGSSPLTCTSRNPALTSGGPRDTTVMSAVGCATALIFDSVEQDWIKTNVLPLYCGGTDPGTITTTTLPGATTTTTTPPASSLPLLQGTVYTDLNGNNKFDSGEVGYQGGATVSITGPTNKTITTDSQGKYSFPTLPVGNYTMSFVAGTISFTSPSLVPVVANTMTTVNFGIPPDSSGNSTTTTTTPISGGTESVCGNGVCDLGETDTSCPSDCDTTGGDMGNRTPTPTPYTVANCVFDPNCNTQGDKSGIQVCNLKCTVISK